MLMKFSWFTVVFLALNACASFTTKKESDPLIKVPKLSQARYRSIWIPDKIEGDRYIEGHRVYIIEEAGRWISE